MFMYRADVLILNAINFVSQMTMQSINISLRDITDWVNANSEEGGGEVYE